MAKSKSGGSPGVFSRKGISAKPSSPAPATTSAVSKTSPAPVSRQPAPAPTASSTPMAKPTTSPATTGPTGGVPAPMAPASGGSFIGNVASSALGSFTGVMVADALFGGNKEGQVAQQNGEFIQPMGTAASQGLTYPGNNKCQQQFFSFMKCLEANNNSSVSSCQWAYDMFKSCNVNQLD